MIYKNIELYNVSELEETDGGYYMLRMPKSVEDTLNPGAQKNNRGNCGVELRFRVVGDSVKIKMQLDTEENKATNATVYYGSTGAGWQECVKTIFKEPTVLEIKKPDNIEVLERIAKENNLPYDPNLVRVILSNRICKLIDVEGECTPPTPEQVPNQKYLAYGSSITHGSLALLQVNTYASRVAENLEADLINMGFAGSAHLEPEMADYIAQRGDWEFATLEMGINMLDKFTPEEFEQRARYFIPAIAKSNPDKKVFCIDVFYCSDDLLNEGKAAAFRSIIKNITSELNLPNVVYINGLEMLAMGAKGLSGDLVHPNVRGAEEIAYNLTRVIRENLVV